MLHRVSVQETGLNQNVLARWTQSNNGGFDRANACLRENLILEWFPEAVIVCCLPLQPIHEVRCPGNEFTSGSLLVADRNQCSQALELVALDKFPDGRFGFGRTLDAHGCKASTGMLPASRAIEDHRSLPPRDHHQ
jgi:hypothetical protein